MSLHRDNCNAIGCSSYVLKGFKFCGEHWAKVPETLRLRICVLQRGVKRGDPTATEKHRLYMREAIKVVRDAEQELTT